MIYNNTFRLGTRFMSTVYILHNKFICVHIFRRTLNNLSKQIKIVLFAFLSVYIYSSIQLSFD